MKLFFSKIWKYLLVRLSQFLLALIFAVLIVDIFQFIETLSSTKKKLFLKPVIATPRLSLLPPGNALSALSVS